MSEFSDLTARLEHLVSTKASLAVIKPVLMSLQEHVEALEHDQEVALAALRIKLQATQTDLQKAQTEIGEIQAELHTLKAEAKKLREEIGSRE